MQNDRTIRLLSQLKKNKKREVIWSLSNSVKQEVEERYEVEEYLYRVETKHLKNLKNVKNKKLREQHFAFKQNKRHIVLALDKEDKKDFQEAGVKYTPDKYRIILV